MAEQKTRQKKRVKLLHIIDGFKSLYGGSVFDEGVVSERITTCKGCRYLQRGYIVLQDRNPAINEIRGYLCGSCKCYLAAKILSRKSRCPEHKWKR